MDSYLPEGYIEYYPSTSIIVVCKEILTQRPENTASQRAAWNSYKIHSTVKYEVGASSSGMISHCSDAY